MGMAGYTKLFNSILASTIWRADMPTRIVWITLLAMADKNGVAEGSVPGLADFARVSLPECQKALDSLMAPDEWSRSQEHEGRRIIAIDGGWQILNHAKYRAKLGADERREYLRIKQAEQRRKRVNSTVDKSTRSTHTEASPQASPQSHAKSGRALAPATRPAIDDRPKPIINGAELRRHGQHAWCDFDRGLCVPYGLHDEFRKKGLKSDAELKAWYPLIVQAVAGKPVGDDLFRFWQTAFGQWVGTIPAKRGRVAQSIRDAQSIVDEWQKQP